MRFARVAAFSRGVARLPRLEALLGCEQIVFRPSAARASSLDAVIGWGHKPTADRAREYARRQGLPYVALEDGFLRSIGGGREAPLSIVLDDVGIYYDARQPSRLEQLLSAEGEDDPLADGALLERARRCREAIVTGDVSKYNLASPELPAELSAGEPYVVVADQTFGDASVVQGLSEPASFERMLQAAFDEHPGARIVLKVHPDTLSGGKRGYLAGRGAVDRLVVAADVSPQALLRRARHAYVCTSQLGFEALLAGVPVTCFGAPFYSGWGLTDDRRPVERRRRRRSLDQLTAAALLLYPRYVHPVSGLPCAAEDVIEHLALNRRLFGENRRHFVCFGFSRWKQPFVRRYLHAPGAEITFARAERGPPALERDSRVTAVVWASRKTDAVAAWAEARGVPLWHMEDGFLRSVGLGSDLTAPGSLVLDRAGIYYDPRRESDLELLLEHGEFSADELARAARLRERIVQAGISKYNPVARRPLELAAAPGQRIVLVPGQVEDDASVRYGGAAGIAGNAGLLRAVRAARPDAYLVYKPHPDVLSGNRSGAIDAGQTGLWDALVEHVSLAECLARVHEVHTLTSLVGFEALLRGLPVSTYGLPFYAGWGLTTDGVGSPRRTRRRSIDELVAAALLRYPRYFSWRARAFCSAEDKVWELEQLRSRRRLPRGTPALVRRAVSLALSCIEWGRTREWSAVR